MRIKMGLFGLGRPKDEALESKLEQLKQRIKYRQNELEQLEKSIGIATEIADLERELHNRKIELKNIRDEINQANDELGIQEFGFFERQYNFSDSTKYKDRLDTLRMKQKELVKNGFAAIIVSQMTLDGSVKKGEAMQKQLAKALIRGFNGEADALLVKVSVSNVDNKVTALRKAYEQLNKMYTRNKVKLTLEYLDSKIEELRLAAEYELQKQEEKELLREQRAKEREDKKLQAEIKVKRKQLEKDRKHIQKVIANLNESLKSATENEIENIKQQISEYDNKLLELDEIEEDIDYREGHATAGYVYVISNIGAFGEDIFKIGVTRRLDPMERIKELGNASVPFKFDVHALVFSEEAFALESELHSKFEQYKVNKVNGRKEYFKVPFAKIKEVLDEHKDLTVELTERPEAFEYRQSLLLENPE